MAPIAISGLYGEPILRGIIISNSAARAWATGWATTTPPLGIAKTKGSLYFSLAKTSARFFPASVRLANFMSNTSP